MAFQKGAAYLISEKKFGGPLVELESNPVSNIAAAQLTGADPERVSIFIINLSANTVYIGFTQQVSAANGILLSANGGNVSFNVDEDGTIVARAFFSTAAIDASQLYMIRMRRDTASK